MLINYFDNSSMLSIYQNVFKKAMIEKVYLVVNLQTNVKSCKILEDQPQKFIE